MGDQYPDRKVSRQQGRVNHPARLGARHADVVEIDVQDPAPDQKRVAVVRIRPPESDPVVDGISCFFRQTEELLTRSGSEISVHFLEADDRGIKLLDDPETPARILSSVPADAPPDIVGRNPNLHQSSAFLLACSLFLPMTDPPARQNAAPCEEHGEDSDPGDRSDIGCAQNPDHSVGKEGKRQGPRGQAQKRAQPQVAKA